MTDKELYKKCVTYGHQALKARRKFIGLLPEVNRREFEAKKAGRSWLARRGFGSIHEFAARLAGISHDQVNRILQLERIYEDKPALHAALVEGQISVNKLVRIDSIATGENQEKLVEKAKVLSSRALEIFVREAKNECESQPGVLAKISQVGGLQKPLFETGSVHVHNLKLDEDVENQLTEMQEKGIDVNAFLRKCLKERNRQIEQTKEQLAKESAREREEKSLIGISASRYIPAKIRKILIAEHGCRCSYINGGDQCKRPAEQIHHEQRYAAVQLHDPRHLKPLCKAHHEFEHAYEEDFQRFRSAAFS